MGVDFDGDPRLATLGLKIGETISTPRVASVAVASVIAVASACLRFWTSPARSAT